MSPGVRRPRVQAHYSAYAGLVRWRLQASGPALWVPQASSIVACSLRTCACQGLRPRRAAPPQQLHASM
jgi:hypothetical protein